MENKLEISPQELSQRIKSGTPTLLLDVREPQEFAICYIEGSQLVPMNTVPAELPRLKALPSGTGIVTICHHGVRSLQVAYWLQQQGIADCVSMAGGIDRWSLEIDPTVPRY